MAARRNRVSPGEAAAFRAVNDLPGWLYPPAWVVMQLGTLGAAPAAAGHAGVAVALGAAALPRLGPGGRAFTLAAVPVVGLTRIYVGAHLPLDVAGGAALGPAIDAALTMASARTALRAGRGRWLDGPARTGLGATKACG